MKDIEKLKTFVKETLGCACPEEVFSYLKCKNNVPLHYGTELLRKINIGNRLLIYVVEVNDQDSVSLLLPFLFNTGKKERDDAGFNRFRLVIATDRVREIKDSADTIMKTAVKDDRVHLHIVPKKDIPEFSDATHSQP
jgi:hypothetical protein